MKEVSVGTIGDLEKEMITFNDQYIYRGMANANWRIRSKIDRELEKIRTQNSNSLLSSKENSFFEIKYEDLFLRSDGRSFYRKYKNSDGKIEYKNFKKLLVLMQHYHYPTRCVDFTSNWQKALFFCLEDTKENSDISLYALCLNSVVDIDLAVSDDKYLYTELTLSTSNKINNFYNLLKYGAYIIDEPFFKRIVRQEGLMVVSGRSDYDSLEDQINNTIENSTDFVKITISKNCRKSIRQYLRKRHITKLSMYPHDILILFHKWNKNKAAEYINELYI